MLCIVLSSVMIIAALASSYLFFDVRAKSYEKYYGQDCSIEAIIVSAKHVDANISSYNVIVTKINGETNLHKAVLNCNHSYTLDSGQLICTDVSAEDFSGTYNGYDNKTKMSSDGIFINYISNDEFKVNVIKEDIFLPEILFAKLNQNISRIFSENLDEDTAAMCSALLLGNKKGLPKAVTRDFNRSGASHVLALSGMHTSILMGFLLFILKRLYFNKKLIAVILSACAIFYLFLTGFQISASRSVIMLLFVYLAWLSERLPDSLTSLGLAGAVLVFLMPGTVIDAGFWMSFAATLGILVYSAPFNKFATDVLAPFNIPEKLKNLIRKILNAVATTLFATIPLIIVLCVFIKQYSFFSIVSSVLLSIPCAVVVLCSFLFIFCYRIPIISPILNNVLHIASEFMINLCAKLSDAEGTVVSLNYPFAWIAALIIAATLAYSLISNKRNLIISLTPYALAIVVFIGSIGIFNFVDDSYKVTYVTPSSQSDLLVITDNNGEAIICDMGNGSTTSYNQALNSVHEYRATEIKALVLTKYSTYHYSSTFTLFSSQKVRQLWIPRPRNEKEYYLMIPVVDVAREKGVDVFVYDYGDDFNIFNTLSIEVYSYYIERSAKVIPIVNVSTKEDSLTYIAPAFNECTDSEIAEINKCIRVSEFLIFGKCGPLTKSKYQIPTYKTTEIIAFGDKTRAAYYIKNTNYSIEYYIVDEGCTFRLKK